MFYHWCNYCHCPCDDGGIVNGKWYCIGCLDIVYKDNDSIKGKENVANDSSNVSE